MGVYVDDLAIAYEHDDEYSIFASFSHALHEWNVEAKRHTVPGSD